MDGVAVVFFLHFDLLLLGTGFLELGDSLADSEEESVDEVGSEERQEHENIVYPSHVEGNDLVGDEALVEHGERVDSQKEESFVEDFKVVAESVGMGFGNEDVRDVHHREGNAGTEFHYEVLLEESKHEECSSGKEDTGVSNLVTSGVSLDSVNHGSEVVLDERSLEHLLVGLSGEDEGSEAEDSDKAR